MSIADHRIGTREEWQAAREQLLEREKEHTRLGDELARQRRDLPWVPVDKEYVRSVYEAPRRRRGERGEGRCHRRRCEGGRGDRGGGQDGRVRVKERGDGDERRR
jgi:hypothetical protein